MALPIVPVVVARVGWMVLGSALTIAAKSQIAKEATEMFKEGVDGMLETYEKDLEKNKEVVRRTKAGKP